MLHNKWLLFSLLAIPVNCSNAFADGINKEIPNTINLKMGARTLRFEHKKHIKSLNSVCIYCHFTEKGKIDGGFREETALILCLPCHDKEPNLKTDCRECHKTS